MMGAHPIEDDPRRMDLRGVVFWWLDHANADCGWPDAFDPDPSSIARAIVIGARDCEETAFGSDYEALIPHIAEWQRTRIRGLKKRPGTLPNSIIILCIKRAYRIGRIP